AGLAYATHPFDINDNFRNTLLSNHWLFALQAGLHFNYKLWEHIYLKSALSLTHYSSAAFKQPNYGVNMVTAGIGAAYLFRVEEKVYHKTELLPFSKRIGVEFSVSGSLIETEVNQPEKHQVWGFSIYGTKRLSRGSRINAGLDLSLNEGIRYQIQRKILADSTFEEVDHKRVGLVIGHELTVGRLSLLTQLGYYVHRQFEAIAEQPLFQRYGLRYYPSGRLFTGLYLKSHGFAAECAELTIGYRWER
ncbi:MAG: acyloxyacyl hydrolase, partial [Bacteroidota bacterium]